MRPLRLVIEGFGSFPGREEIDFSGLATRGLFVVTGPTGSGKTTVFDAMVFALYGRLPGSRDASGVRSQHATPDRQTRVVFDFEIDGVCYRVERNPEYQRPKVRGTGTTKAPADATLVRLDGHGATPIATKARPCAEHCAELVGLDADQFARVVLLPQGEFDRFLTAAEAEREELLRKLFGGEIYKTLTDLAQHEAKQLEGMLRDQEQQITLTARTALTATASARRVLDAHDPTLQTGAQDQAGNGPDLSGASLGDDALDPDGPAADIPAGGAQAADLGALAHSVAAEQVRLEALAGRAGDAAMAATAATDLANRQQQAAERFDRAATYDRRLAALAGETEAREADRQRVGASRAARPVVDAAEARAKAETAAAAAGEQRDRVAGDIRAVLRALGAEEAEAVDLAAAVVAERIARARAANDAQRQQLRAAKEAQGKYAEGEADLAAKQSLADACAAQLEASTAALVQADERLRLAHQDAGNRDTAQTALDAARTRHRDRQGLDRLRAELSDLDAAELGARDHYHRTMQAYLASEAPRLAAELHPGEPCMVCGSTAHPAPARAADDATVSHDQVTAANEGWAQARSAASAHRTKIGEREAALADDAHCPLAELAAAVAAAQDAVDAATAAAHEVTAAAEARQQAHAAHERSQKECDTAKEAYQHAQGTVTALAEEAQRLAKVVAQIDPDRVAADADQLDRAGGLAEDYESALTLADQARTVLQRAQAAAAEQLDGSPFDRVDQARAALLEPATETELANAVGTWETALADITARREEVADQGLPETRPDVEALVTRADQATELSAALQDAVSSARTSLEHAGAALAEATELSAQTEQLRQRRDTARVVADTCAGRGTTVPRLERWVLAAELRRVANAANAHLARLTKHRYQLRLPADGGKERLDLVVFDAHSGGERSTGSLSGGEKFQASLALALGLADVVSHGGTASGRTYQALFVDEGFGSLDPQALDEAIGALASLQEGGRMVGAITHVEAMKQQLHVGIEVRRRPDAPGSTLKVFP